MWHKSEVRFLPTYRCREWKKSFVFSTISFSRIKRSFSSSCNRSYLVNILQIFYRIYIHNMIGERKEKMRILILYHEENDYSTKMSRQQKQSKFDELNSKGFVRFDCHRHCCITSIIRICSLIIFSLLKIMEFIFWYDII